MAGFIPKKDKTSVNTTKLQQQAQQPPTADNLPSDFWGIDIRQQHQLVGGVAEAYTYIDPFDFRQVVFCDSILSFTIDGLIDKISTSLKKQLNVILSVKHFGKPLIQHLFYGVVGKANPTTNSNTVGGITPNSTIGGENNLIDFATYEITEQITKDLSVAEDGKLELTLNFMSGGGSVNQGFRFITWIEQLKKKLKSKGLELVYNGVGGFTASMGVPVFLTADKRYISRSSVFLIHPVSGVVLGKLPDVKAHTQFMEIMQNKIVDYILRRTNGKLKKSILLDWMQKETYLDSSDVIKYGLADGYVD